MNEKAVEPPRRYGLYFLTGLTGYSGYFYLFS
jgi:hypothetical protein